MSTILEAHGVNKEFTNHKALSDVNLAVPEGSIYGLLGPNGAGKTTFIRIINQITAPDSGQVLFKGVPLSQQHISRIGYLPEERGLYKKMKVGEQALYLAQLKGMSKQDATTKLKKWFDKFDILNWWSRKVEELSKGMQQKVQFIVTIVHEPELLIFDEPFSGFDPINANLLKDEILELKKNGSTVIFSTHNMSSVEELCDHIALIDNSHKILEGRMKDIREQYRSNTYRISYTNPTVPVDEVLTNGYTILDSLEEDGLFTDTIRLSEGTTQNQLVESILPGLHLQSFNEILPSMNDIFIRKVNENKKNQTNRKP
ncbi:MAG: ATP-binding cassette domain-containing protein [Bacteroidales bacterium]|nr:ATP-binding cassette domain-containing protein [Bacteroidales bacterium]